MPDVNLIEEEGGEGGMQPIAAPTRRRGGGGGGSKALLILILFVVFAGGVFALNKFGIVKLWGKKAQPAITQIQEPIVEEPMYSEVDTAGMMMEDTSGVSFVETPPLTPEYESALVTGAGREISPAAAAPPSAVSSTLPDMKGNYTIQVSAWRDMATAEKYVKRLETAGYPAFVEQRSAKSGNWYTVRIGRYTSLKEAKKAVDTFAYELKKNYWIDKVRSN